MISASILIATRNRAAILPRLFDALARQRVVSGAQWELIVVDNGSTDESQAAIDAEVRRGRLPLLALFEPVPGKSRALNLAIARAKGELLVFTDDDVEPEPEWLQSYLGAAVAFPEVSGFAGRVLPRWLGDLPDWLHTEGPFALPRGITNTRDFGMRQEMLPPEVIPGGVNTALRRAAVARNGAFREQLGPGTLIPYAEDTEYMSRYLSDGGAFLYVPTALLHHCNVPERMTKAYVCRWMYQVGRCQVLALNRPPFSRKVLGLPLYLVSQAGLRLMGWLLEPRPLHRFQKKMRWMSTAGQLKGYRQLQRGIGAAS